MNAFGVFIGLIFCGIVGGLEASALGTLVEYSVAESLLVTVGFTMVNAFLLFVVGGYGVRSK